MKTNGTVFTIEYDGKPIGILTEFEMDDSDYPLPEPISWSAEVEFDPFTMLVFESFLYSFIYRS